MPGQRKISSFFSPAQIKRPLSSIDNNKSQSPSPKKLKDDDKARSPSPNKPKDEMKMGKGLSPEQRQRMEGRRREALKILQCKEASPIQVTSPSVKSPLLVEASIKNAPVGFSPSWAKALSAEFSKPYFVKLQEFVEAERGRCTVYPPREQVFTWTQMGHIRDVKVVILGQDPYHGPGQAHGLCFSVPQGIKPPPSLANMYKCLEKDIEGFQRPGHGNLTSWSKQGVLLLNAVLTVRANNANSHKDKGWETFTTAVISWLNSNLSGVVFMLWGSYAQKKCSFINAKRHHVLKAVHPSPLSAHRGFFQCAHFSQTNELLKKSGKTPIDWKQLSNENCTW